MLRSRAWSLGCFDVEWPQTFGFGRQEYTLVGRGKCDLFAKSAFEATESAGSGRSASPVR